MKKRSINFIGYRRVGYIVSAVLVLASIITLATWGLRFGIDFTGGSLSELRFVEVERPEAAVVQELAPEEYGEVLVTPVGDDSLVLRLRTLDEPEHQALLDDIRTGLSLDESQVVEERFTSIGPTIGVELRRNAVWSLLTVLSFIVLYVAWAFRQVSRPVPSWQYGAAAIVALVHDVVLTLGVFSFLGAFYGVEVGTLFITALLTVLGFSVHDTIVVFDRVREQLGKGTGGYASTVNKSLNDTLARSINTSITTLLVLLFTLFFGGESIKFFVLALAVGIVLGTYSSIFVAAPALVSWHSMRQKRQIAE